MSFIDNLPAELFAAEAAGLKPNLAEYQSPRDGEEVLATITDRSLLAIVAIYDRHKKELLTQWPTPPNSPLEMAKAAGPFFELFIAHEAMWETLREATEINKEQAPALGLRRNGNNLVIAKQPSRPRFTIQMLYVTGKCGDPNCKKCNPRSDGSFPGGYHGEA